MTNSLVQQTRIVSHDHLGVKLPDCIQHYADHYQECCTIEQLVAANARDKWSES